MAGAGGPGAGRLQPGAADPGAVCADARALFCWRRARSSGTGRRVGTRPRQPGRPWRPAPATAPLAPTPTPTRSIRQACCAPCRATRWACRRSMQRRRSACWRPTRRWSISTRPLTTTAPGRLSWAASPAPEVDTREPVVYQRIAHTRLGGRVLLQLVYSLWFPERPARPGLDLLAGRVDAVVLRLTLDGRGRVLLLDSIHGCGCYHVFVPGASMALRNAVRSTHRMGFCAGALAGVLAAGAAIAGAALTAFDHQLVGVSVQTSRTTRTRAAEARVAYTPAGRGQLAQPAHRRGRPPQRLLVQRHHARHRTRRARAVLADGHRESRAR